jgi:hypothetical protein
MAKKTKLMTPKKGVTIGRGNKQWKHGDIIPEALLATIDKNLIQELKEPKMTPKPGMELKVDKKKYEPGAEIDPDHLKDIDPQFVEELPEPDEQNVSS